jgi:hypothetical protein
MVCLAAFVRQYAAVEKNYSPTPSDESFSLIVAYRRTKSPKQTNKRDC